MSAVNELTIAAARDRLAAGEITSVELTEACLGAIEGAGALGAVVHATPEIALDQARAADAAGERSGLSGIPLGVMF